MTGRAEQAVAYEIRLQNVEVSALARREAETNCRVSESEEP